MSTDQSPTQQGPSIEGLTAFFIGTCPRTCSCLWGVVVAQAVAYYRTYQNDNKYLKIFVFSWHSDTSCRVLSTAQLATLAYTVYFWMIVCRNPANYRFLGILGNSLIVVPAYITYFLTSFVQCFYAMRVWFISVKQLWLVATIVALAVTQLVGGFALVSYMTTINDIITVYSKFNHVPWEQHGLGSSMVCDVLISTSLWWYLRKSRGVVFGRTKNAINKLILQAVNIGLLTNVIALVNLITWLAAPESSFTWAVFHFSLGKIYVISMLASLNAREEIRHNMNGENNSTRLAASIIEIDGTRIRRGANDFGMGRGQNASLTFAR
ncbi:hypothetical protein P691DRAFT_714923 [Macrolepiota fuliginosa MF-IS2]|uniref:DUF6534 domain-containing protein n=1 Tax=Macrolepiota fuliginosa MF-IS2 TaxID=1400762 RepID=A0A9P5WZ92_9AGAR|nr:hypothetical protein P691DRAFT_714923 [Macrolepiota fuliginosa MF-IS2]